MNGGAHASDVLGSDVRDLWPTSGLCSRGELVHDRSGVTPRGQPMLSWTFSSLGSPARGDGLDHSSASSRASAGAIPNKGLRTCLHSRVSFVRGRGLLSLESAFPF
jgi:hypothetical protein